MGNEASSDGVMVTASYPMLAAEREKDVSDRWGLSAHSCRCANVSKTGLVFYAAKNSPFKNVVLLQCERCYGFNKEQFDHGVTQHKQLYAWYKAQYPDKTHVAVSGFAVTQGGELGINSGTFNDSSVNCVDTWHDANRAMSYFEKKNVVETINGATGQGNYNMRVTLR